MPIRKFPTADEADKSAPEAAKAAPEAAKAAPEAAGSDYAPPVIVELAKSGRSKCCVCCEQINGGDMRVGIEAYKSGRMCMGWNHPACYKQHVWIGYNTSGRGKCKMTKKDFQKGDVRFSCATGPPAPEGKASPGMHMSLEGVATCVPRLLQALGLAAEEVKGFGDLRSEDQDAFKAALAKGDAALPTQAPAKSSPAKRDSEKKTPAKKAPAKKAPAKKKAKKEESEEEASESEEEEVESEEEEEEEEKPKKKAKKSK